MDQMVKNLPTEVRSLGWEDPLEKGMAVLASAAHILKLEKGMATHSSICA